MIFHAMKGYETWKKNELCKYLAEQRLAKEANIQLLIRATKKRKLSRAMFSPQPSERNMSDGSRRTNLSTCLAEQG